MDNGTPRQPAERVSPQHAELDREGGGGRGVRIASVGRLSVIFLANRALRHLSVLDIVWLGQPRGDNAPTPASQLGGFQGTSQHVITDV
ncbi:hypothetical protein [Streptomyces sp. NPDC059802]|uniref:hypothetical protein n=1 Tax=Streptomyces sp. NPDC059802 TaxID=3346952 RepID=UPI003650F5B7